MRLQKTRTLLFFILAFSVSGLEAQEAIPFAGGDAVGTGGTVSYTLGQLSYTTLMGDEVAIYQGVQQPIEILEPTAVHSTPEITLGASLFPNPAGEFVNLKVENFSLNGLTYQLFNMQGELMESRDIESRTTEINLTGIGSAPYLMKISLKGDYIKVFRIIKK